MAEAIPAALAWSGSTLDPNYSRSAELSKPEGLASIPVSSLPAYGGLGERWNPEDLLAGALAHCHMLTFLAIAAKARVEVLGYQDRAEATMVTEDRISRVERILLQPTIRVAAGTDAAATWRFGVCCPNSPYRDYAAAWAGELLSRYPVDGVRFDMTFWPAIC